MSTPRPRCAACGQRVWRVWMADGTLALCRVGTGTRHVCVDAGQLPTGPHAKAPGRREQRAADARAPGNGNGAGNGARQGRQQTAGPPTPRAPADRPPSPPRPSRRSARAVGVTSRRGAEPPLLRWWVLGGRHARCAHCDVPVLVRWDARAQDTVLLEVDRRTAHRCGRPASRELAAARKAARAQVALEVALRPDRPRRREEAQQPLSRPATRPKRRSGRAAAREFGVTPYDGPNSCPNCGGLLAGRGGDRTCFHCGA